MAIPANWSVIWPYAGISSLHPAASRPTHAVLLDGLETRVGLGSNVSNRLEEPVSASGNGRQSSENDERPAVSRTAAARSGLRRGWRRRGAISVPSRGQADVRGENLARLHRSEGLGVDSTLRLISNKFVRGRDI